MQRADMVACRYICVSAYVRGAGRTQREQPHDFGVSLQRAKQSGDFDERVD